jgi:hypothetical protein
MNNSISSVVTGERKKEFIFGTFRKSLKLFLEGSIFLERLSAIFEK